MRCWPSSIRDRARRTCRKSSTHRRPNCIAMAQKRRREVAMADETALAATPVLIGRHSDASITDRIADIVLARPAHWGWVAGAIVSGALALLFVVAISWLLVKGVGIWGNNQPVAWAFAITNFV